MLCITAMFCSVTVPAGPVHNPDSDGNINIRFIGETTWGDPVVMRSRPVWKDVFDLKKLIGSVSSYDGEPKALGAFSQGRLQDGALQLRRVSCKAMHSPTRLFCCGDGRERELIDKR